MRDISTHWVLKAPLCDSRSTHIGNSTSGRQADLIHTRDQKLGTRNMKGFRFLGVGGNRSARRKPTKAGMESANQIHIQPLASCIGERKVFEHLPTRLATGVVCHPNSEQKRPYKIPWPCRELNRGPTALQARTLPVCYTTPIMLRLRLKSVCAKA